MDAHDEIFADPILPDKRMSAVDKLLTKILYTSNKESRKKLLGFLKRWQSRVRFVNLMQAKQDEQTGGAGMKAP